MGNGKFDIEHFDEDETEASELSDTTAEGKKALMPSDLALPLILLKGAFMGPRRGLLTAGEVCVIVRVPSQDWVGPVAIAAKRIAKWGEVVSAKKVPTGREGYEQTMARLSRGGRVLCVSVSPERFLPPSIVTAADAEFELQPVNNAAIRKTILAVTGKRVRSLPKDVASGLNFTSICAALRQGSSPKACVERLLSAKKSAFREDPALKSQPPLSQLYGYGEAMDWANRVIADLDAWRAGTLDFSEIERTVVLASEPGLGKTTLVRSFAKAAGLPLFASSVGAWFAQSPGYLDSVVKQIDALFGAAEAAAPAVVFLDEIEAIPSRATLDSRSASWWTPVIGHMLTILDGAGSGKTSRLIVIGATNHPEKLDPALTRPGRLSRILTIERPDAEAMAGILRQHLGEDLAGVDLGTLASVGAGGSGADAMDWVKRARARARQENRPVVVADVLDEIAPSGTMDPSVLRRIALHEAGHAVVAETLEAGRIRVVSIAGSGRSGGRTTLELPETLLTKAGAEALVMYALGGTCAEELCLGEASSGSGGGEGSDLAKATDLVAVGHVSMGMGEGLAYRAIPEDARRLLTMDPSLLRAVERDLRRLHDATAEIIQAKRAHVEAVADCLEKEKILSGARLREILQSVDGLIANGVRFDG